MANASNQEIQQEAKQQVEMLQNEPERSFASNNQQQQDEKQNQDPVYPTGVRLAILTLGMMAVVLMVALDNYILATAIPRIATDFQSLTAVGWYSSSYFLTQMALQPPFGHLISNLSMKNVYLSAMILFEVGSILCATAKSSAMLIIGRLIAGGGGAGLYIGTLTLVAYTVPIRKRPLYLSLVTSMHGVASVAGPLLGGVFTDSKRLTWRFCFWINLPIGLLAFILVVAAMKTPQRTTAKISMAKLLVKLDIPGVLLVIASLICLILALEWGGNSRPWSASRVWGCLLGFALLFSGFVVVQIVSKNNASIPLPIARQRTVASSSLSKLLIYMCVGTLIYYLPFYFQAVQGTTAGESGKRNLAFLMTLFLTPMLSGALINWWGIYVPFMWVGTVLAAVGSGLLYTLDRQSSLSRVYSYQFLVGFGIGICNQIPYSAVQAVLPPEDVVMGTSLVSFCNSLGPVLGTNIAQAVFSNVLINALAGIDDVDVAQVMNNISLGTTSSTSPEVRDAFSKALASVFIIPTACSSLALLSSFGMEWVNIKTHRVAAKEESTL